MKTSATVHVIAIGVLSAIAGIAISSAQASDYPQDAPFTFIKKSESRPVNDQRGTATYETGVVKWFNNRCCRYQKKVQIDKGANGNKALVEITIIARPNFAGGDGTFTFEGVYNLDDDTTMGGVSSASARFKAFEGATFTGTYPNITLTY